MISLQNIEKYYHNNKTPVNVLNDISLDIKKGEIFGIIGQSGAGKSTLLRCINLLERPDKGKIIVDQQSLLDLSIKQLRKARRQIGMVFQHFNLIANRTVYENIVLPLKLAGWSKADIDKALKPLAEFVGLTDKLSYYPAMLSGGQKQRVAITRALITHPKVLLCDEITSALDPETTLSILKLLKMINERYQISIVFITHEMSTVKEIADQVAVIDQGVIVECDDVVRVFTKPQQAITKKFVNATLAQQLPSQLTERMTMTPKATGGLIVCLRFDHNADKTPVISELVRQFDMVVCILQGSVEVIRHETIGILFIEIRGDLTKSGQILAYLDKRDIDYEVQGYVN